MILTLHPCMSKQCKKNEFFKKNGTIITVVLEYVNEIIVYLPTGEVCVVWGGMGEGEH